MSDDVPRLPTALTLRVIEKTLAERVSADAELQAALTDLMASWRARAASLRRHPSRRGQPVTDDSSPARAYDRAADELQVVLTPR